MNPLLTRSERNLVAHIFAGFLFNPLGRSYPLGVSTVLQQAGLLNKGDTLRSDEVTIAYEAQVRDLLFLNTSKSPVAAPTPSATAFDIVVKYRKSLASFEVKFLTGWKPSQLCQELKDCEYIKVTRGFSSCSLILLYPSWRDPGKFPGKPIPKKVIQLNWQHIRLACQQLANTEPEGHDLVTWMNSLRVPTRISDDGTESSTKRRLFDPHASC
ncbi:MAG: hypothetical protein HYU30_01355 [Chloroflexi bacterium]|nr:hypothetical protein [Chloroflexota bacterium]